MNNFLSNYFGSVANNNNQQSNQDSDQLENHSNDDAQPTSHVEEHTQLFPTTTTANVPGAFPAVVRVNMRRTNFQVNDNSPPTISFSTNDRLAKRILLSNILPLEIADLVLDFAGVFKTLKFDKKSVFRGMNCDEKYLVTKPFHFVKIRRIRFRGESKDQGWSSDNLEFHGTRQHSWTWGEIYADDEESVAKNLTYTGDKTRIYTNIHAGKEFEAHDIDLKLDLKKGQVLVFAVRALYPAMSGLPSTRNIAIHLWKNRGSMDSQSINFTSNNYGSKLVLLLTLLPVELAEIVLRYAQVYKTLEFSYFKGLRSVISNQKCIITRPFKFSHILGIRVRARCIDQSTPYLGDVYNRSPVWGEIYSENTKQTPNYSPERDRVFINLHAGKGYKDHNVDIRIELKRGQILVFCVRSKYEGWELESASIEFSFM
ncbi:hypothetical protein HDV06_007032 [Boothiomyces sp. JEL0866]|nr:hypothetical protein HDV06_007032 [Boothiomyces sp. JEL0866]